MADADTRDRKHALRRLVNRLVANHVQADVRRLTTILHDFSIHPLWYDDVAEIAPFVKRIAG